MVKTNQDEDPFRSRRDLPNTAKREPPPSTKRRQVEYVVVSAEVPRSAATITVLIRAWRERACQDVLALSASSHLMSNTESHILSLIYSALFLFILWTITSIYQRNRQFSKIPSLGSSSWLISYYTAVKFLLNSSDGIKVGYTQVREGLSLYAFQMNNWHSSKIMSSRSQS